MLQKASGKSKVSPALKGDVPAISVISKDAPSHPLIVMTPFTLSS